MEPQVSSWVQALSQGLAPRLRCEWGPAALGSVGRPGSASSPLTSATRRGVHGCGARYPVPRGQESIRESSSDSTLVRRKDEPRKNILASDVLVRLRALCFVQPLSFLTKGCPLFVQTVSGCLLAVKNSGNLKGREKRILSNKTHVRWLLQSLQAFLNYQQIKFYHNWEVKERK